MTITISERANAYRLALRDALNDGLSIKVATDAAKKAARGGADIPQQKPVVLTDEELRLIDRNELTEAEYDRLYEMNQASTQCLNEAKEQPVIDFDDETVTEGFCCANCGIPHAIHGDECGQEGSEPSCLDSEELAGYLANDPNINVTHVVMSDDCPACSDPFCMGDCPSEDTMIDALGQDVTLDKLRLIFGVNQSFEDHELDDARRRREWKSWAMASGANPPDWREQEMAKATLADAWRDGVGIETPAHLRLSGRAHFMAGLGLTDHVTGKGYVDYGEDLSHAEKVAAGMPEDDVEGKAFDIGGRLDDAIHEAVNICIDKQMNDALREPEPKVRDCDIPATLRAVEIYATEHDNGIRQWFDGDDEVCQFLANRREYLSDDRSIKDLEGNTVGMWFYAHFGPTPVS